MTQAATRLSAPDAKPSAGTCLHCGQPTGGADRAFCCGGCEVVYGLLRAEHLDRYYDLRQGPGAPVKLDRARSHDWLASLPTATGRVTLDVQGIHCSACVWLVGEVFRRQPGARQVRVNPGVGRVDLWFAPETFSLGDFVRRVEAFGYLLGPERKRTASASRGLALRLGVSAAIALNSMLFSFAFHFGLRPSDGVLYTGFGKINAALATAVVLIGGSYFFRSAWQSLRQRVLHLDVPIALGIALSYAGSVWAWFAHGPEAAYFDTVCSFTALMLLGKYLPQRMLERNQSRMLEDDGVDQLPQKRVLASGELERCSAGAVRKGDVLVFAPGDLVAVDVTLRDGDALCSLDWITGEAEPRRFGAGEPVPAGAFNAGGSAFRGEARSDFADSPLRALLAAPNAAKEPSRWARFTAAFSRWYVAAVLALAALTFAGWALLAGDPGRGLIATIAVLVVTCPCAIGLANPLAHELALTRLRRAGLFARTASALEKLAHVRTVALDKTGTLTDGDLRLVDRAPLEALAGADRAALAAMVVASNHPFSRCLADSLPRGQVAAAGLAIEERAGRGIEARGVEGAPWRLGSAEFCGVVAVEGAQVHLCRGDRHLAAFRFDENPRPDAREEIGALRREGFRVAVLSGDSLARARALGGALGVEPEGCLGGLKPEDKARWIGENDAHDLLMLGDGINDTLAFQAAYCSGTPAVHRPFVPARADFYYLTAGLAPIRTALRLSRRLQRVLRANVAFALTYNAAVVTAAIAGWVTPLVAAVVMPASSILVVAFTSWAMRRGEN